MKTKLLICFFALSASAGMAQPKNQNMNKNYVVEIIRYNVPQDQHQAFEKAYDDAGKLLAESPVCLGYQVIKGSDEPDHYIVIINWTSVDDHLNVFRRSQQFGAFFNLVKPFYNNIQEMKHYNLTSNSWTR